MFFCVAVASLAARNVRFKRIGPMASQSLPNFKANGKAIYGEPLRLYVREGRSDTWRQRAHYNVFGAVKRANTHQLLNFSLLTIC